MRIILLCFLLYGCAGQPERISYSEFSKQYQDMKTETPDRIVFDFHAACNDEGKCFVTRDRLERAATIMTELNTAYQKAVEAGNSRLDAIGHCEYANAQKDAAIQYLEQAGSKQAITSQIKQLLTIGGCALLLGTQ